MSHFLMKYKFDFSFNAVLQPDFEKRIGPDSAQVPAGDRFRTQQRSHEKLPRTKGSGFAALPSRYVIYNVHI